MNDIKSLNLDNLIVDCRYSNEKYTKQILSEFKYEIIDFSQSYINIGNYIEGRLHEDS